MMAFHLPHLQILRFKFSRSAQTFHCGTGASSHHKWTLKRVEEQILSVNISNLGRSWEYFQLQTPGRHFVVRRSHSDSDGRMQFIRDLSTLGQTVN